MERELWPLLYRLLRETAKDFRQKYVQMQPWVLVAVLLWAARHDRPLSWACPPRHWSTTTLRPARLPSPSALSRRLHGLPVGLLRRALEGRLRQAGHPSRISYLDGKPLPVGSRSKDPDARPTGPSGPGYKLHALWTTQPVPVAWEVTAAGAGEAPVAERLVARGAGAGYLLADGNYDATPLFGAAAAAGYQLLVPAWRPGAGPGHRYQSPYRLRSIALAGTEFGRAVYALRGRIERAFGNAGSFGGGLAPLPAWVRGWYRVHCWVAAKLLINGARIVKKQGLTTPLQVVGCPGLPHAAPSGLPLRMTNTQCWRMCRQVFGGEAQELYLALLKERCAADGLGTAPEVLARQFRLHLHRGISYLAAPHQIRSLADLLRLVDSPPRHKEHREAPG